MKKAITLSALSLCIYFLSCSKNNNAKAIDSPTSIPLPIKAETKPQYDHTNQGVYKGVIIGSTGIILFYINNGDNVVKCYLTIDNQKDTLTTSAKIVLGQPIVNAVFTGKISSVVLNTDANGGNATLSDIKINGHPNVGSYIVHENSTSQVLCYEGTINGDQKGTFNCIRFGSLPDTVLSVMKLSGNDTTYFGVGGGSNINDPYLKDTTYVIFKAPNQQRNFGSMQGRFYNDTLKGFWSAGYALPKDRISGTLTCVRTY